MSPVPGSSAGMAILTFECEAATPGRLLIRVKLVADTLNPSPAVDRAFSDLPTALAYLRASLEEWLLARGEI